MDLLKTRELSYRYPDLPSFRLENVSLSFAGGSFTGLLGPNGSGKSTLLKLLAGFLKPRFGSVLLEGKNLLGMDGGWRARRIAFVPQSFHATFPFTAWDLVLMGRHPHRNRFRPVDAEDRRICEGALKRCDALPFKDRLLEDLSGGERQRVLLASALAQQPRILLLDEPATSLDLSHQVSLFGLLGELVRKEGLCVICALHDLNQALRSFPRVVLLQAGRVAADGIPAKVLTGRNVRAIYGVSVRRVPAPGRSFLLIPGKVVSR